MNDFVKVDTKLVRVDSIKTVDLSSLESRGTITVCSLNPSSQLIWDTVSGADAINTVMKLCPSALEGQRLKWIRHKWAIHNLIGHPVMQLLSFVKLHKWAIQVHERTIPRPVVSEIK